MILSHNTIEHQISFEESKINVLIVENQRQLYAYLQELNKQSVGLDGGFSLYEKNECLDLNGKIKVLIDIFNIDFNSKELLTPISSKLIELALDSNHYQYTNEILSSILNYMSNLIFDFDVELDYKDITIQDLIKSVGIRFDHSDFDLLSNLCDYFELISKYTKVKLFVLVNIRDFLSDEEVTMLNQHIMYHKINVLFIESKQHNKHENESIIVIDSDLCEIFDDIS